MLCPFTAGQRVVCIAEAHSWCILATGRLSNGPRNGDVCKIVKLEEPVVINGDVLVPLKLEGWDDLYDHRAFRALNERPKETSIEVFRKLLTGTPQKVKA